MSNTLQEAYILILFVASGILFVVFTSTLIHIRQGSKWVLVSWFAGLLIISNLGTVWMGITNWKLFVEGSTQKEWVYQLAFAYLAQDMPFCVVHWLLASQYRKVSREIPQMFQTEPEFGKH